MLDVGDQPDEEKGLFFPYRRDLEPILGTDGGVFLRGEELPEDGEDLEVQPQLTDVLAALLDRVSAGGDAVVQLARETRISVEGGEEKNYLVEKMFLLLWEKRTWNFSRGFRSRNLSKHTIKFNTFWPEIVKILNQSIK